MFRKRSLLSLACAALAFPACAFSAVVYTQTSATGLSLDSTRSPTALDDVNFAVGSTLTSPQRLSAMTIGAGVLPTAATTGTVFVNFYNTVNPASLGAVNTDLIGGFSGTLTITAATANAARAFNFTGLNTLTTPIDFNDDTIGVVITFGNAAGNALSTILTPLMSVPGVPTVGSSVPGVYRDSVGGDGVFQAAELVPTAGNLYLSITTINVPEPVGLALALPLATFVARRRRA